LAQKVAAERGIPVVGNGDILTHYEARERMQRSGVRSVMLARGALIKPWLFREIREGRDWLPTADERFGFLLRFVGYLRDHFGDDERGRRRAMTFLPWHLGFFCRYRPLPEAEYGPAALEHPLIHQRHGFGAGLSPLETLLRDPREETHAALATLLIESGSDADQAHERALQLSGTLGTISEEAAAEANPAEVAG
jgi:tRNA-dihydrouridine synthase 3